ncbi:MAG TPA: GNAT family protein [Terracidiphilus sp.]|nr:GNAT family protein [Terracidiphilus sp.]
MNPSPSDLESWKPASTPHPVTLRGRYVVLETFRRTPHAAPLWQAIHGHDELWTWLAGAPTDDPDALANTLEQWQEKERALLFTIIPLNTGTPSGWASYMRIEPAHGVIEVGNVLFAPVLQRTRAATEAIYLMARHAFEDLGYRRFEWKCNALNEASRRAALRFGFTFEGIFRQHMVVKGRSRDTAWFAMLDGEWPARKHAFEAWLDPANFNAAGHQRASLSRLAASHH